MNRLMYVFVFGLLTACAQPAPHETTCGGNLQTCAIDGDTCQSRTPGEPTTLCDCENGRWICNSCPWATGLETGACTSGETCATEDWEHGCHCVCSDTHTWSCEPETQGSTCPHASVDAGIDAP